MRTTKILLEDKTKFNDLDARKKIIRAHFIKIIKQKQQYKVSASKK